LPVVAIIDTGLDPARIDPGRLVPGVNLSLDGDDTHDPHGHGTAIAATVLANSNALVLPVKLIGNRGYLRADSQLEVAFEWIVDRASELAVVCASFADASHATDDDLHRDSVLRRHILALREAGVPVVAPAGNAYALNRLRNPQGMAWPAILREVVSVGALGLDGATLSHHTQRVHDSLGTGCRTTLFAAPGAPGGTSGAAAVVAGRLADLRAAHPSASVAELVGRLLEGTRTVRDDNDLDWPVLAPTPSPPQTSP
jgi:subtilisin family serine protease